MKQSPIWHPCTQMKDRETHPFPRIRAGKGIYLFDENGKSYIDAVSSWWVNLFGHSEPRIAEAIRRQAETLEHVIFAGFTHDPAETLVEKLMPLVPAPLSRVFFADNGSAAVESAMKMSHGHWLNAGHPEKSKFVFLTHGYHGETLGALSLCGESLFREQYGRIMPQNIEVPGPDCYRCPYGLTRESCAAECFEPMEATVAERSCEVAAIMVEPLVQCAGGFRMYPPVYLRRLRDCADRHGVHLIFDEIAVGFGRTGTMFACEQADVVPDLMCLSKGITSGFLPLSVVLATEEIYAAFYGDWQDLKAFWHSHSYTGNPLACAAASATMDIFAEDDVLAANRPKMERLGNAVRERFEGHPNVGEIRQTGFICAVELVADPASKTPLDWRDRTGFQIYRKALERGALLRNLGDLFYFMPPYVIAEAEIDTLVDIAHASLVDVLGK